LYLEFFAVTGDPWYPGYYSLRVLCRLFDKYRGYATALMGLGDTTTFSKDIWNFGSLQQMYHISIFHLIARLQRNRIVLLVDS
jgi:hypothetical protein